DGTCHLLPPEDLSVAAGPGVYVEGTTVRIEARVQADASLFPKLFIDECYGIDAQHQSRSRRAYIIADNRGCLYASDSDATWFRKEDEAIVFTLRVPAFLLDGESEEVGIHLGSSPSEGLWCLTALSFCVSPGRCHTMKKLLLVSVAFVGSCVLAALFLGVLLALGLALFRYSRTSKGHRLLKNRKEQPYHTELQTVVEALAIAEEIEKESTLDYCKLKSDIPEKEA
ncbi:hypothetical protein JD844_015050, partial [Phrynosoma platyrhinos]